MALALRFAVLSIWLALPAAALAAPPAVEWPGSSWSGPAQLRAKISGAGTLQAPATLSLDFGPQVTPALAPNEFLMQLDDGTAVLPISGTYALDEKNRPQLMVDAANLATDLQNLFVDVCFDELGDPDCDVFLEFDFFVDPSDFRAKLKAKDDDGVTVIDAKGKLPIELFFEGQRVAKASISFRATQLLAD